MTNVLLRDGPKKRVRLTTNETWLLLYFPVFPKIGAGAMMQDDPSKVQALELIEYGAVGRVRDNQGQVWIIYRNVQHEHTT